MLLAAHVSSPYLHCCVTGVFAAAHDLKTEWVVVKGIKDYADGSQVSRDEWAAFASVMAASVVANILSDPVVFQEWPNYQGNRTHSTSLENWRVSLLWIGECKTESTTFFLVFLHQYPLYY